MKKLLVVLGLLLFSYSAAAAQLEQKDLYVLTARG